MNLVIISGQEATGKTAIGKRLADDLGYIFQSKDTIKETLFDAKEHNTWDYKWFENNAKQAFFEQIHQIVNNDQSAVIESNFIGEDKARLEQCITANVTLFEIYCTVRGMNSFRRFVHRNETGARHKGHHDRRWYPKILLEDLLQYINIRWPSRPSGLTKNLLVVDSTDFSAIDYPSIVLFIKSTHEK